MLDLRNTVRDVFRNIHFTCPHCGKKLDLTEKQVLGRTFQLPCYGSCGCDEAQWDMLPYAPESSRKYAMAGIPQRYLEIAHDTKGYEHDVAQGTSLFIHGPNGTAKSTYAASVAKALIDMGVSVAWVNSKHLISEIQGMFDGRKSDVLERCYACRVLVLDDLGKEQPTPYSISTLYELVEMRYGERKPIVATSNFDRVQLASRWASADAETAAAIVSRLCDSCSVLEMYGEDRRV